MKLAQILFMPPPKRWVLEGNENTTASKGSKTARDVHMQISSLHLFRYPTFFYSNCQPNGSILRVCHFTTTSTLPLAPIECRTGILIRFNHNSHNSKNIPRQKHNAPLSRMLYWTETRTVKRMEWENKCRFKDTCTSDNSRVHCRPSWATWKRRAC